MNKKIKGYVMLPCFTVEFTEESRGCDLTCGRFLGWIFEVFFAPFWSGKVYWKDGEQDGGRKEAAEGKDLSGVREDLHIQRSLGIQDHEG